MGEELSDLFRQVDVQLKEKNVTPRDLIATLLATLSITHIPAGLYMGSMTMRCDLNMFTSVDAQVSGGTPPRSLLEALLFRVKSQYAMDRHNLGVMHRDELARAVTCEEILIWLLQAYVDLCEHKGIEQILAFEEWAEKQRGGDEAAK